MLDGLCKIDELVAQVKKFNQPAIALTDHGVMHGAVEFYNACLRAEIKPIIGVEIYLAKNSRFDKQVKMGADQYHLTLLAQNFTGYQNLMKMVSIAHLEGFSYKPRIDLEILAQYAEGVIATSGCMSSLFNRYLLDGKTEQALELAKQLSTIFPDRFYIELQVHSGIKELPQLTQQQVAIAREVNLPLVATNDAHYVEKSDAEAQDALLCVQTHKLIADENRMSMIGSPDYYVRSTQEMLELFADFPEAVANSVKIAEQCQLTIPTGKLNFPKYPVPEGETDASYLAKLAQAGFKNLSNGKPCSIGLISVILRQ